MNAITGNLTAFAALMRQPSPRAYFTPAKKHAAHLACAARYRCQAEGLLAKANDDGPFGWKGPWGGPKESLIASAKQAMKFARQEIELARAIREGN